jgi:pimeloyl-ACP methyl ester carboxylesterase
MVTVPEEAADPAGPTIEIAVAYIANEPLLSDVPLVFLNGGPGAATLEYADAFVGAGVPVVLIDQRGTGISTPNLDCPELDDLYPTFSAMPSRDEGFEDIYRDATRSCRDRLLSEGVNVGAYTTANNANDIDLVRTALELDEWNIWGSSYGTRLALATMRDHPEGIRAVVLDATFPQPVDLFGTLATNADRAIQYLIDSCSADQACDQAFGDLGQLLDEAVSGLDAEPVTLTVPRPGSGEPLDYYVDGPALYSLLFDQLYDTRVLPRLPLLISQAANGDVRELVDRVVSQGDPEILVFSEAMYDAVNCPEEVAYFDLDEMREFLDDTPEPFQVAFDTEAVIEDCAIWDLNAADPSVKDPVSSSIPTLVVSGSFDPITPPDWGRLASGTLSNSTFVELGDQGHGIGTICGTRVMFAFLVDPTGPQDLSCVPDRTVDFETS